MGLSTSRVSARAAPLRQRANPHSTQQQHKAARFERRVDARCRLRRSDAGTGEKSGEPAVLLCSTRRSLTGRRLPLNLRFERELVLKIVREVVELVHRPEQRRDLFRPAS